MTSIEQADVTRPFGADSSASHRSAGDDRVNAKFLRFLRLLLPAAVLLPFLIVACTRLLGGGIGTPVTFWLPVAALFLLGMFAAVRMAARLEPAVGPALEALGQAQARFIAELPRTRIPLAIAVSAGASLFLELAIIRWHGSVWEVFAFYKNFSLLACFLGLGLGYALARRQQIPAVAALVLLALQVAYLVALRHAVPIQWLESVRVTPFPEQLNMGVVPAASLPQYIATYALLTVVLLFTALVFVPIGQLCGRLLDQMPQLRAYGWNLVGSLGGVALMFLVSYLWTPPVIWFLLAAMALIALQAYGRRVILIGLASAALLLGVLAWPVVPGWERIYSPYQLLERGPGRTTSGYTTSQRRPKRATLAGDGWPVTTSSRIGSGRVRSASLWSARVRATTWRPRCEAAWGTWMPSRSIRPFFISGPCITPSVRTPTRGSPR
jgi:hypothetical protein